jgi:hypothetical protein
MPVGQAQVSLSIWNILTRHVVSKQQTITAPTRTHHRHLPARAVLLLLLVLLLISGAGYWGWHILGPSSSSCFSDDFTASSLHPGWNWVNPAGDDNYSLSAGSLKITAGNDHNLW